MNRFEISTPLGLEAALSENGKDELAEGFWYHKENQWRYVITVPANTTATLLLPAASLENVLENGSPVQEAEGISNISQQEGRARMELGSGSYTFIVNKIK